MIVVALLLLRVGKLVLLCVGCDSISVAQIGSKIIFITIAKGNFQV
jgi:hypothetical protein